MDVSAKEQATRVSSIQIQCQQISYNDQEHEASLNFKVTVEKSISLPGERILTGLDAAIRKIQFLKLLPQLYVLISTRNFSTSENDCGLESIIRSRQSRGLSIASFINLWRTETEKQILLNLHEQFVQDLLELAVCQLGWRRSKLSKNGKSNNNWEKEDKFESDGPVVDERGHETHLVNPSGMSTRVTQKTQNPQNHHKKHAKLISVLKKDEGRSKFFQDLLNSEIFSTSPVKAKANVKVTDEGNKTKTSTVELLKMALKGRYSSHVRKSMRDHDLQSLLCILSIIASQNVYHDDSEKINKIPEISSNPHSKISIYEEIRKLDETRDFLIDDEGAVCPLGDSSSENEDANETVFAEGDPETLLKASAEEKAEISLPIPLELITDESVIQLDFEIDVSSSMTLPLPPTTQGSSRDLSEEEKVESRSRYLKPESLQESEDKILLSKLCMGYSYSENHFFHISQDALTELRLQFLYTKVLDYLSRNPMLVINLRKLVENFEAPSKAVVPYSKMQMQFPSWGYEHFVNGMKNLRSLMKSRLISNAEQKGQNVRRIQILLFHQNETKQKIEKFEKRKREQQKYWESELNWQENEIQSLQEKIITMFGTNESRLFQTVKSFETIKLVQEKYHDRKILLMNTKLEASEERLATSLTTLNDGYRGLKKFRKELESELGRVIKDYDRKISELKEAFNELKLQEGGNELEIKRLHEENKEIEETYQDMKNTKRLREILQNLRMAESVKQNWAARRIQEAWRRYKVMKWRKKRFKKGGKKKKDSQKTPKKLFSDPNKDRKTSTEPSVAPSSSTTPSVIRKINQKPTKPPTKK